MCNTFAELSEWFQDQESHNDSREMLFELAMEKWGSYNVALYNIRKELLGGSESNRYLKTLGDIVATEKLLDRIVATTAAALGLYNRMLSACLVEGVSNLP